MEELALDTLLGRLSELGLVSPGGKQSTDATHVISAMRGLNRLELAGESVRAALEALAVAVPGWLAGVCDVAEWNTRYGVRVDSWQLPTSQTKRDELAAGGIRTRGAALAARASRRGGAAGGAGAELPHRNQRRRAGGDETAGGALTRRTRHRSLEALLRQLNPMLRGWCHYFRHGVSKATFEYLDDYAWHRVTAWLRKRHRGITWKELYRRFLTGRPGNRPAENGITMFDCAQVEVTRYRWRANNITTPFTNTAAPTATWPRNPWSAGCVETRSSGTEGGPGKRTGSNPDTAPRPDPYTSG